MWERLFGGEDGQLRFFFLLPQLAHRWRGISHSSEQKEQTQKRFAAVAFPKGAQNFLPINVRSFPGATSTGRPQLGEASSYARLQSPHTLQDRARKSLFRTYSPSGFDGPRHWMSLNNPVSRIRGISIRLPASGPVTSNSELLASASGAILFDT